MGHLTKTKETAVEEIEELTGAVPAEIDFGSPRAKDCPHFGICRINYYNRKAFNLMPSCCPNQAYGYIRKWEQNGIELIFPKENMAPATLEKHFGTGWFTVMDEYELPPDMAERLRIAEYLFVAGRYPVLEMDGRLHVVFA